ncbi:cobalamin-dependent protein [Ramlibacter sp. XY19]|uniref:cobalamin-dependent protein n=1 Tax=Ramlibacter paludis TaxID=2908000 RepID=UPI0023DA6023|nr:cobalamin-dependent protein [Ramlibacter paludis]MCG2593895.1 cobalamin-dependent protein [Ramlibacter paludis]
MVQTSGEVNGMPIASVEQATGIARATLRIWERRYGFPRPERDLRDERSYGPEQVEKLRLIAALVARGLRPGRLVPLPTEQLVALADATAGTHAPGPAVDGDDPVLDLLRAHDAQGLAKHLDESVRSLGLAGFITGRMPALNELVGEAWARGALQVYEEHLYTEVMEQLLHHALLQLPGAGMQAPPNVVLATLPTESHGLGLLMAQAMLALQGCRCISLGVRVPVAELLAAAAAFDADIVGLSFSASHSPSLAMRGLEQLRGELPTRVALWAGGSCPAIGRRKIAGVQAIREIGAVPAAVAAWRATNPSPAA